MKIKIITAIIIVLSLTLLITSCGTDSKTQLPEIFDRGINFNISEEQLLKSESALTFETYDNGAHKELTSNEQVMVNGDYANVCYTFLNDKLKIVTYNIDVIYPKTQIDDVPAYQVYDKYKSLLTDTYGAPIENDGTAESSGYSETYSTTWAKDVVTPSIYVIQTKNSADYSAYPSEINDSVEISFVFRDNLSE